MPCRQNRRIAVTPLTPQGKLERRSRIFARCGGLEVTSWATSPTIGRKIALFASSNVGHVQVQPLSSPDSAAT